MHNEKRTKRLVSVIYTMILFCVALVDLRFAAGLLVIGICFVFARRNKSWGPVGEWLEMYDWAWTVPMGLFAFWLTGYIMQDLLALTTGTYDFSFLQPVFMSVAITSILFAWTILLIRFNWTSLYRYWVCDDCGRDGIKLYDDIKMLTPWQRLLFLLLLFFSYMAVSLLVYRALV